MKKLLIKAGIWAVLAAIIIGSPVLAHKGGPLGVFIYGWIWACIGAESMKYKACDLIDKMIDEEEKA